MLAPILEDGLPNFLQSCLKALALHDSELRGGQRQFQLLRGQLELAIAPM